VIKIIYGALALTLTAIVTLAYAFKPETTISGPSRVILEREADAG
jgi:hypothetical protein